MTGAQQQYMAAGTVQNNSLVPVNVTLPVIAPSAPPTIPWGTEIACSPGTWTNGPQNYLYSWAYDGSDVEPIGIAATYVVGPGDAGCSLVCTVTAVNQYGQSLGATTAAASPTVDGTGGGTDIGAMNSSGVSHTPTNYTSLINSYNFSSGILQGSGSDQPTWNIVVDDGNNYTAGSIEYTAAQVGANQSDGCVLTVATDSNPSFDYQSGLITTRGISTHAYGRFRFAVQMPQCANPTGLWPACWMLTDPGSGPSSVEIDVVEMNMYAPYLAYGTLHAAGNTVSGPNEVNLGFNAYDGINIFEVIWEPGYVTWGVNNVAYAQYSGTAANGAFCYLLVNNAVSYPGNYAPGGEGAWDPTYNSEMPVPMYVMTVQVYG